MKHRTFIVLGCLAAGGAQATLSYNEFYNGDLSYLYPGDTTTVLNLGVGQNTVYGRLSSWGDFDTFAFNVPQASQLNGVSLSFGISTATGYFPSNQSASYGLSSGIGLPYAPYPNGNYAQTVNFSTTNPTPLFPLATPLGAGTYTLGDFVHNDFSGGYVDYAYTLSVQLLTPPPIANGSYGVFTPNIPSSFPNYSPTSFGEGIGGASFDLNVINGSVVIGVDIGLAGDIVGELMKSIWETGIENAWNNKYELVDDALNHYPMAFDVHFSEGLSAPFADWVVDVHDQQANPNGSWVNSGNWYTSMPNLNSCINNSTMGSIAAHEFGHFLGLYDEYTGGTIGPLGIHEGSDAGLMGPCPTMPVQERYFDTLLTNLNEELGRHLVFASAPGFSPIAELPSDAFFPPEQEQGGEVPEPPTLPLSSAALAYCIFISTRRKVFLLHKKLSNSLLIAKVGLVQLCPLNQK